MGTLLSLGYWDLFIACAVLLVLEILAPGAFMLWLGLSAFLASQPIPAITGESTLRAKVRYRGCIGKPS